MNTVPAGLGPHVHQGIANSLGPPLKDPSLLGHSKGKGVHQNIRVVGLVKENLTTHGGDAHAVTVSAYSAHDTVYQVSRPGIIKATEAQRIE